MARAKRATMAPAEIQDYLKLVPAARKAPGGNLSISYDAESDTLYVSFGKSTPATDSEMTDDDVIIRYAGDQVVGLTILRASQR